MLYFNTNTSSCVFAQKCGWTLIQDAFAVDFSVSLKPLPLQSVHNHIRFSATSSVTSVTLSSLSWDFGDLSPRVNTTGTEVTTATHKYGLPGRYAVSLTALAEPKVGEKIQVINWYKFEEKIKLGLFCKHGVSIPFFTLICVQASKRGEVTVTLPPKLELRCPTLAVANKSLEFTLVSWGTVGVVVDWKLLKDGVQVAKGETHQNRI